MHDLPLYLTMIGSTTETALISVVVQIKVTLVIYYITFYTILPEKTTDTKVPVNIKLTKQLIQRISLKR